METVPFAEERSSRRHPLDYDGRWRPSQTRTRRDVSSMTIIALIPAAVCIALLFRRPISQVFLNVYLPVFALLPTYYFWKVSALPPINLAQAALLPIGVAIALKLAPRWKFTTMDLWVALFMLSTCVADFRAGMTTASIFDLFNNLAEGAIPYMIGKTLIEQEGLRVKTARRLVLLMTVCFLISAYEYRMAINPFNLVLSRFFPGEDFGWNTQLRWGFGRVAGPFGQSELAGMVIMFTMMMALWLTYTAPWPEKFRLIPWHPFRQKTLILAALVVFLFMTQARGPWLGCLLAVPIAMVGRTRQVLRNSVLLLCVLVPLALSGWAAARGYTAGNTARNNEQQNAQYRAQLLDNYLPEAEQGGAFGWGQNFPQQKGQDSIDNEFLFIWLVQGWVGLGAFLLLCGEGLVRMVLAAVRSRTVADRFFAFTLFGAFAGILLTITTVFLGNQPFQLFFLIAGWAQVLQPQGGESLAIVPGGVKRGRFAFRQVLT